MYYMTGSFHIPAHLQSKLPIPGGFGQKWLYTYWPNMEVEKKSIIMGIIENDTLIMTLGGWMHREKLHSIEAIKEYLASIIGGDAPVEPWVFELFDVLEKHIDEVDASYTDVKIPACSYIKYHEAPKGAYPRNFVGVGDSVMKVNPVFAQGMAKACMGAVTLGHVLQKSRIGKDGMVPETFARDFFKLQASRNDSIWQGTKGTDYGIPTTIPVEGESLSDGAGTRKFFKHLMGVAKKDHACWMALWKTRMFIGPPTDAMTPWVLMRVFWGMYKDKSPAA
ncbi:hypothetical protein FRC02_002686 [Tulasnella sp. 418]|nr:hypothetical protein FRC02_002686 [Tulasnella sp. 418]